MEDLRDHDSAQFSEMAFAMMLHITRIRGNRYKTKLNMTSVVLQTIHLSYLLTKLNTLRPGFQRKLKSEKQRSRDAD